MEMAVVVFVGGKCVDDNDRCGGGGGCWQMGGDGFIYEYIYIYYHI